MSGIAGALAHRAPPRRLMAMVVLAAMVATSPISAQQAAPSTTAPGAADSHGSSDAAIKRGGPSRNDVPAASPDTVAAGEHSGRPPTTPHPDRVTDHQKGRAPGAGDSVKAGAAAAAPINASIPSGHRAIGGSPNDVLRRPHIAAHTPAFRRPSLAMPASPVRNAIGIPIGNPGGSPGFLRANTPIGVPKMGGGAGPTNPGVVVIRPTPPTATANQPHHADLTGTGMVHVGSGPATVGGAARTAGGINGTDFRSRHGNP